MRKNYKSYIYAAAVGAMLSAGPALAEIGRAHV